MDNLTHSLIGVALARAASPWFDRLRGPLIAAVLANNLPDIDLAWLRLFEDPRLGYLLHHRGHTHTLALALPQALAAAGIARAADRQARWGPLIGVSAAGIGLHIGFDYMNNYGVHPFWPVDNLWYYGDTLFIIDPVLWAILIPAAVSGGGRWLLGGAAVALLAALAAVAQVASAGPAATLIWAAVAAGLWAAAWRGVSAAALAWGPVLAWLGGSAALSWQAKAVVAREFAAARPGEVLLDAAVAPLPARPWCFNMVTMSDTGGPLASRTYHLRAGQLSLLPALTAAADCRVFDPDRTLTLSPEAPTVEEIAWEGGWSRPSMELQALLDDPQHGCRARQFFQVARAPFWTETALGDLRYDYEKGYSFAEIDRAGPCLAPVSLEAEMVGLLLRP